MSAPATARFADFVRGLFGLHSPEPTNVLSDVIPTVNLLEEAPHLWLLRDERAFFYGTAQAAGGAATFATILIAGPPAGNQRALVITDLWANKAALGAISIDTGYLFTTGAWTVIGPQVADLRSGQAVTHLLFSSTPAGATGTMATTCPAGAWTRLIVPQAGAGIVIPPMMDATTGITLRVCNPTANETLNLQWAGYTFPLHGNEDV